MEQFDTNGTIRQSSNGALMNYLPKWKKLVLTMLLVGWSVMFVTSASAGTATSSGIWPAGQTPTRVPNIAGAGVQNTTFTGYTGGGPYNYRLYTFTVDTTGSYTATSTTTNVVNTTWFLNGTFSPDPVAPATPIGNFIVGVFSGAGRIATFTNVPLVAGQPYTILVAFNTGGASGDLSTVTINGPGCIALAGSVCAGAVGIPTLSEWSLIGMSGVLGIWGMFAFSRRNRGSGHSVGQ